LRASYRIPSEYRNNVPESYAKPMARLRERNLFPVFPFGSDLTPDELVLKSALERIAGALKQPSAAAGVLFQSVTAGKPSEDEARLLARMQLEHPRSTRDKLYRRLLLGALQTDKH
jgi:hypothetical protein